MAGVPVVGAFDSVGVVSGAFDDAGAGPVPAGLGWWRISASVSARASERCSGGDGRLVGDLAARDAEAFDEGHAVGVVAGRVGGVQEQGTDGVVGQQQSSHLLFDQVGGFRAKDLTAAS